MKKYIAALAACVVTLAACATPAPTPPEPTGVLHTYLFASYEVLEGWLLDDMQHNDSRQVFFPVASGLVEPTNVSIEIHPTGMPADVYEEISEDFRAFVEEMLTTDSGATILSHEYIETPFGGAIITTYANELDHREFVRTQFYLLVDDYVAIIVATDYADDDSGNAAEVAHLIVSTLNFSDLADLPAPEMPPSPFGGEWIGNVYVNELLGLHFTLPQDWEAISRDLVAMYFGPEAEQFIQVMAVSEQGEMLQIFVDFAGEEWGVRDFLESFAGELGDDPQAQVGEITEVEIAGFTFYSNTGLMVDTEGNTIMQHTIARAVDEMMILAITFLYNEDVQSDVLGFLETALGE